MGKTLDGPPIRIAVFPVERLTVRKAPYSDIRQSMIDRLSKQTGANVLGDEAQENFMLRHRIRYRGGIDKATARAFKAEEGVDAVLLTSIELYDEVFPPKIGLIARLVSTGEEPVILWMDSVSLAGDDSPGILGIGLIADPVALRQKALRPLVESLAAYLSGNKDASGGKSKGRYGPKIVYRDPIVQAGQNYTVAVAPFFNSGLRPNAGEILALHFVKELVRQGSLNVIELGVVRERLLNIRVIMYEGMSLGDVDAVSNSLGADLIVSGKVIDYGEYRGESTPILDFSVVIIDRMSKRLVWASKSYNRGDDGVFFFDRGKVNTTGKLVSAMVRAVVEKIFGDRRTKRPE